VDNSTKVPSSWDMSADFVVIGSSCGGLTAACKAHELGLSTVVIEKCETLGGGTAFSGGVIWIPYNHHMMEKGLPDSREAALEHIRRTSMGRHMEEMLAAYLDKGPEMLRDVEKITPLRMQSAATLPDYRDELPGGSKGGRLLAPEPIYMAQLLLEAESRFPLLSRIRRSPLPLFSAIPLPTTDPRFYVAGRALIGGLLLGCIEKKIPVMAGTPARKLITDRGVVVGVRAEQDGKDFFIRASKGVLLATGGFEWNAEMNKRHLKVPDIHGITPPGNSGDGHVMGMEVGGAVALMDLSLFLPTIRIPDEEIDGKPWYRNFMFNVGHPGNIIVNRDGKRCCNECFYPDIGRAFEAFDSRNSRSANLPMYWIVDQAYRDRIPVGPLAKGTEMAGWIHRSDTIEDLALELGVPSQSLDETVRRFNRFAKEGLDPDYDRGETGYDKRWAFFPNHKPNPVLGALEKAPFYGVEIHVGTVGNLGGLVTNKHGQVLDAEGNPIMGLYATSNAAAPLSTGYAYTSGMTGGKAMIFGWASAIHAAGAAKDVPDLEAAKDQKAALGKLRPVAAPAQTQPPREEKMEPVAAAWPVGKTVKILNEDGSSVLDLEAVQNTGDRLRMKGRLMGSFDTNMYMDASGLYSFVAMAFRWGTIKFLLLSPLYWHRGRKTRRGG
jgi:3-oxosteroid 1-dehydrogenase